MKMHNRGRLECTAIIIAGGRSTRMGRDKRLLRLGGESFLERMLAIASGFAGEVILSLADEEQARKVPAGRFRIVYDESPGKGPLYGLISAAKHAEFDVLAVMPVDSPLVDPELYTLLTEEVHGYDAAVPVVNKFPEPLHAVYIKNAIIRRCGEEIRSMNHLLKLLNVNFVPEEKIRGAGISMMSFVNVNTPEEYERLRETECM